MEYMNDTWFERMGAHFQRARIAKVSFQTYWFSDEDTVDELHCFDENEQEVAWPPSLSSYNVLWELVQQEKEPLGRFELYLPQKRLVRLGAAHLADLKAEDEEWFYGGRDDEAIEHVYTLLQTAAIRSLTLQSYRNWDLHEIVNVHCFDEDEHEVALPGGLSVSDLRVAVREAPMQFGRLKLLVSERRWLFLGALDARECGLDETEAEAFEGGEGEEVDG